MVTTITSWLSMGEDSPGVVWSIWAPEAVVFTMKRTKAAALSLRLACARRTACLVNRVAFSDYELIGWKSLVLMRWRII